MTNEEKKLYLLDAYALIYRSYYAFINNPRITTTGINTSATFGFFNFLLELLELEKPTHLAVVFDPKVLLSVMKCTLPTRPSVPRCRRI